MLSVLEVLTTFTFNYFKQTKQNLIFTHFFTNSSKKSFFDLNLKDIKKVKIIRMKNKTFIRL